MHRHTAFMQPCQLRYQRLAQRRQRQRILHRCWHIEDAELNRVEEWMRANIPPDLLPIINHACRNQRLHIGIEISPGAIELRYAAARKWPPNYRTIRLDACKTPTPERRIRRKRQ